jgi:hypothetical protein
MNFQSCSFHICIIYLQAVILCIVFIYWHLLWQTFYWCDFKDTYYVLQLQKLKIKKRLIFFCFQIKPYTFVLVLYLNPKFIHYEN